MYSIVVIHNVLGLTSGLRCSTGNFPMCLDSHFFAVRANLDSHHLTVWLSLMLFVKQLRVLPNLLLLLPGFRLVRICRVTKKKLKVVLNNKTTYQVY